MFAMAVNQIKLDVLKRKFELHFNSANHAMERAAKVIARIATTASADKKVRYLANVEGTDIILYAKKYNRPKEKIFKFWVIDKDFVYEAYEQTLTILGEREQNALTEAFSNICGWAWIMNR
jgi:hypothetical protein